MNLHALPDVPACSALYVLIAILVAFSPRVDALQTKQIFEEVSPSAATAEALDAKGAVLSRGSGVLIAAGEVVQRGNGGDGERFGIEIANRASLQVREDDDYPREARQNGWRGTTQVRLHFGADGKVTSSMVTSSSGYAVLDDKALEIVQRIEIPPVPALLRGRQFNVHIPIVFKLKRPILDVSEDPVTDNDASQGRAFVIRLGAFPNPQSAETMLLGIRKNGFAGYVESVSTQQQHKRSRLRVGPFSSQNEAEEALRRLFSLQLVPPGTGQIVSEGN